MVRFTTSSGEVKYGVIIRVYQAFEGGTRYIVKTDSGEYRCVKDDSGRYAEYVA